VRVWEYGVPAVAAASEAGVMFICTWLDAIAERQRTAPIRAKERIRDLVVNLEMVAIST
jgi:hypothetical protein